MTTTGGYTSTDLAEQARAIELARFGAADALRLGTIALDRASREDLAIVIEVHHLGRIAFRAALPGSLPDSDDWIVRKSRVVERFGAATLAVRVRYEERGTTFVEATGLPESQYAAHGGGLPIEVAGVGRVGAIYVSGLPQVDDHEFAVSCVAALRDSAWQPAT